MLVLLSNDYSKGLNLAFRLFRILNDQNDDISVFADTLRLILFPTIFEDHVWVTYSPIDDVHFCKKMDLLKPDKENRNRNQKAIKMKRSDAIALEVSENPAKHIASKVMAMIPIVRSIPSILAIEL